MGYIVDGSDTSATQGTLALRPERAPDPAPVVPRVKLTSALIRQAISKRWAPPEYAVMWEVGRATGAVSHQRYADAVIMSIWPSRGLELHGVEIKVSRSDWRREAADPAKAEAIAAYCDRWWVFTGPGVIQDTSELPPMWGAREFDGKSWRTIKEAERTEAKVCDRAFLASLLRRADGESRWQIEQQARDIAAAAVKAADEHIEREIGRRSKDSEKLRTQIADFEEASGLSFRDFMLGDAKAVGAMVKAVNTIGLDKSYGGVTTILNSLRAAVSRIEGAIKDSDLGDGGAKQSSTLAPDEAHRIDQNPSAGDQT